MFAIYFIEGIEFIIVFGYHWVGFTNFLHWVGLTPLHSVNFKISKHMPKYITSFQTTDTS